MEQYKIIAVRVLHNDAGDKVIGANKYKSILPHVLDGAIGGLLFTDHADVEFFVPSTNIEKIFLKQKTKE